MLFQGEFLLFSPYILCHMQVVLLPSLCCLPRHHQTSSHLRLIRLKKHKEASFCRNLGARHARGEILAFIKDADLGGFNIARFDLPLLKKEFEEIGKEFHWQQYTIYDAQKIYHLHVRRDRIHCLVNLTEDIQRQTNMTMGIYQAGQ